MKRQDFVKIVSDTLLASIPPGGPPMFEEIIDVRHSGSGRKMVLTGYLRMFDGKQGEVKLEPFQWGWSIQWTFLPGGPFMLYGDKWVRVPEIGEAQGEAA